MSKASARFLFIFFLISGVSCMSRKTDSEGQTVAVQVPVTVTGISKDPLEEYIDLNATSTFLLKNYMKANATGYLQSAPIQPGQFVKGGQALFTIKTKEAEILGNTVNNLDSSFKFSGTNVIRAGTSGFISQINHQSGDYVQDGEQLAVINDVGSFVFLMELPYELRSFVKLGARLEVSLPDGEKIPGQVTSLMPTVESVSQTQNIVIKVNPDHTIPENLVSKVRILKIVRNQAVSLPRSAVLADETQTNFWVMKMIDSVTAVKIPVKKGIETRERIEILSPVFSTKDKILLSGNYGLPDTARVRIISND
jgi:multidrug efflux pump subunit AcrA (membrane-fusion protein)